MSRISLASWRLCCRDVGLPLPSLALVKGKQPPTEERPHKYKTDEVDAEPPPGMRVTAGADRVKGRENIDAQRQDV